MLSVKVQSIKLVATMYAVRGRCKGDTDKMREDYSIPYKNDI